MSHHESPGDPTTCSSGTRVHAHSRSPNHRIRLDDVHYWTTTIAKDGDIIYCFTAVTLLRSLVGYLDIKYEPARFRWRLDRGYCFLGSLRLMHHESWSLSLRCTRYGGTGHISWISNWWSRWEDLNQRFFWLHRSILSLKLWYIYDVKC